MPKNHQSNLGVYCSLGKFDTEGAAVNRKLLIQF